MRNKYISLIALVTIFFMNILVFHYHDLDLSNENVHNYKTESLINEDVHDCDICNLSFTKYHLIDNSISLKNTVSHIYTFNQHKSYSYKDIYKISNKSPPVV